MAVTALSIAATILLVPMLAITIWNLFSAPRFDRPVVPRLLPRVSLLVPARNEATNLAETLPMLLATEYPDLEILVLDDGSTDSTARVVRSFMAGDTRLRLLAGLPLPPGWLGKNWACHQLAEAATGEVLVFCDADVSAGSGAVRQTVVAMQAHSAGAVTVLPRHQLDGWIQRAVVPLITQMPALMLLPFSLVARHPARSLVIGNGQWLAFTRESYGASGGHAAVRAEVVEDVALARRVKCAGYRLVPMVSTSELTVSMYRDAAALREGFAKNLYALAGGHPASFTPVLLGFCLVAIYPWIGAALGAPGAVLPLALLLTIRLVGILILRQGIGSLILHPAGSALCVAIALESFIATQRRTLQWKGRPIGQQLGAETGLPS